MTMVHVPLDTTVNASRSRSMRKRRYDAFESWMPQVTTQLSGSPVAAATPARSLPSAVGGAMHATA